MTDEIAKTIYALDDFVKYTKKGIQTVKFNSEFDLFHQAYLKNRTSNGG
jgi:hypothetical protein